MTDTTDLTDSQKLDRLLAIAELAIAEKLAAGAAVAPSPASASEPPHVPELALADIDPRTIDGKFVQRDGSSWIMQTAGAFGGAAQRHPIQWIYGYISEFKDPELWEGMVATFGGDEARLREVLAHNGPFARYRTNPKAYLGNFILMSMLLGSASPETKPSPMSAIEEAKPEERPAAQVPQEATHPSKR